MSRSSKKRIPLLLIGGVIALFALNSCIDPIPERSSLNKPAIEARETEIKHFSDADGHIIWIMNADLVQLFETSQETRAEVISLTFYDESGEEALNLTSDSLVFYIASGDLAITGNIVAEDASGIRFTTDEAYWDAENSVLRGDSPVFAEREDFSISGAGFAYDPNERTIAVSDGHLKALIGGLNE